MRMRLVVLAAVVLGIGCERPPPVARTSATSIATPPAPTPTLTPASATPPTLTPTPAYDLAADLASRISDAKRELGDTTPASVEADVFVIAGPGAAGTVKFIRDTLAAYFNGRFEKRPARAVSVYMFASAAPYDAYCKKRWNEPCLSPYGFYHPDPRIIVMNAGPGIGTLSHELVHPIVETDFPRAPTWINEGIASLFEAPVMPRAGEIHGAKNWRHPRLIAGLASPKEKDESRLDALFGMSDARFRGDNERLHYATARYVCQWLDARGELWPFYRAWRDDIANDPTGARAFAAVTKMSPEQASELWLKWVRNI